MYRALAALCFISFLFCVYNFIDSTAKGNYVFAFVWVVLMLMNGNNALSAHSKASRK